MASHSAASLVSGIFVGKCHESNVDKRDSWHLRYGGQSCGVFAFVFLVFKRVCVFR